VFIRHGETQYTGEFPDLTDAGKETIKRAAVEIRKIRSQRSEPLRIMSSPAPRALGSAAIISQIMGYDQRVITSSLLSPAGVRDKQKGADIFNEHVNNGGFRQLSASYGSDQRYEDPAIFEPRTQVVSRFYEHLGQLVRNLMAGTRPLFVVCVSHYEVMYHLVETSLSLDYAKDHPLTFGELALLSFYDIGPGSTVEVCMTFRDRSQNMVFDYKKSAIVR
jgi:broad specificity phosphatase PhoE